MFHLDFAFKVSHLTFAISAQLFPASLMVFNLCSSAGVHGVFVRLFLAGGPIEGEAVKLGSSPPSEPCVALDGPDIVKDSMVPVFEAGLLFRELAGDEVSALPTSVVVGCARAGRYPETGFISGLSPRLDIGDDLHETE